MRAMIPWRKWLFGQHGHSNRFVADHADLVRRLIRRDGIEKAMEVAVGGGDSSSATSKYRCSIISGCATALT